MRKLEYLSPTSIAKYKEGNLDFYRYYLADIKLPRSPQTEPMAVGSAFDAYIKSYLYEKLIGKHPKYELTTLFEAQVEPHNRTFAREAGRYCFEVYQASGAGNDLLLELSQSVSTPRFEIDIQGVVSSNIGDVMFLGKPDVSFINGEGVHVAHDFKVNGYCSKFGASPMEGYVRIRGGKNDGSSHKEAVLSKYKGMLINVADFLENLNAEWANQLSIYSWLMGNEVGSEFIASVDQLVCRPDGSKRPGIRVAEHKLRVSSEHQHRLFKEAKEIWDIVQSDHFFRELDKEGNDRRCAELDGKIKPEESKTEAHDDWFESRMG